MLSSRAQFRNEKLTLTFDLTGFYGGPAAFLLGQKLIRCSA